MKRLLIVAFIGVLVLSCKQGDRTDYEINGKAEGVHNGVRVYLKNVNERGEQIVKDTAIVVNEKFKMEGAVQEPTIYFLSVDGVRGELIFMLENSEISLNLDKNNLIASEVKGSQNNQEFKAFQSGMDKIRTDNQAVILAYRGVLNSKDSVKKDSVYRELQKVSRQLSTYPLRFLKDHRDSYFSLNLIGLEANKPKVDIAALIAAFDDLTPQLKDSPKGIEVREKLDKVYEAYQKTAHLEIGKIAPNFEAPTPDGTIVSLNELKGKVTIIDFWAAWCGPCRKENPNVVRVYEKYHDQGLEIIGVSLDGQSRQNDPKKAWLDAIEKDKLPWHHVSHLQYFNDPVAQLYNITAIPATYILDKEGKIAYKNLRGKALELKVEELLGK